MSSLSPGEVQGFRASRAVPPFQEPHSADLARQTGLGLGIVTRVSHSPVIPRPCCRLWACPGRPGQLRCKADPQPRQQTPVLGWQGTCSQPWTIICTSEDLSVLLCVLKGALGTSSACRSRCFPSRLFSFSLKVHVKLKVQLLGSWPFALLVLEPQTRAGEEKASIST